MQLPAAEGSEEGKKPRPSRELSEGDKSGSERGDRSDRTEKQKRESRDEESSRDSMRDSVERPPLRHTRKERLPTPAIHDLVALRLEAKDYCRSCGKKMSIDAAAQRCLLCGLVVHAKCQALSPLCGRPRSKSEDNGLPLGQSTSAYTVPALSPPSPLLSLSRSKSVDTASSPDHKKKKKVKSLERKSRRHHKSSKESRESSDSRESRGDRSDSEKEKLALGEEPGRLPSLSQLTDPSSSQAVMEPTQEQPTRAASQASMPKIIVDPFTVTDRFRPYPAQQDYSCW